MMFIHGTWGVVYCRLLENLLTAPPCSPRSQQTREICGVSLRVDNAQDNILEHPVRNLNYRFMVAEWLWIALGRNDVASIARYNRKIAEFSDDGLTFAGAYGPRLTPQWQWLIKKIEQDGDTRQAVASIWTPNPTPTRDVPCTLSLQFLYRAEKLNCIATMRSSDVWLGLPYDFFDFSMLLNGLAGELGVEIGWLQLNLASSHLYDRDYPSAMALLDSIDLFEVVRSPKLEMMPPQYINHCFDVDAVPVLFACPWDYYTKILTKCNTRVEALEALREISTHA